MDMFICPTCTSVSSSQATTTNLPLFASFYPTDPCVEFQWGEIDGTTVVESINDAYEEVIHWKRNSFLVVVPSGRIGKEFVLELARLYQAYADNTTLYSIALTACFIFQVLLLLKPHAKSKTKDHITCLECRLALWHAGDFSALIKEGKCIQDHLQSAIHKTGHSNVARDFDRLMSMGKISAAVKLFSADARGGVLSLDSQIPCSLDEAGCPLTQSVNDILTDKHPPARMAVPESLLSSDNANAPSYDPILFDRLTGDIIKLAAFHTQGAAGPSGVDAYSWRRQCSSF